MPVPTLYKQPSEARNFTIDFADRLGADTITAITSTVATPTGLTIGTTTISGSTVIVHISAGTTGTRYKITCVVATSGANTLEEDVYLLVIDN